VEQNGRSRRALRLALSSQSGYQQSPGRLPDALLEATDSLLADAVEDLLLVAGRHNARSAPPCGVPTMLTPRNQLVWPPIHVQSGTPPANHLEGLRRTPRRHREAGGDVLEVEP